MPMPTGTTYTNPKPYKTTGERFVLRVEAFTDGVPGMFYSPGDLMQWLCSHPYIKSAKLLELGPEQHNVRKPPFSAEIQRAAKKEKTENATGTKSKGAISPKARVRNGSTSL